jgi:hypothetical protein
LLTFSKIFQGVREDNLIDHRPGNDVRLPPANACIEPTVPAGDFAPHAAKLGIFSANKKQKCS